MHTCMLACGSTDGRPDDAGRTDGMPAGRTEGQTGGQTEVIIDLPAWGCPIQLCSTFYYKSKHVGIVAIQK